MAGLTALLLLAPLLAVLVGIYVYAATRAPRSPKLRLYDQLALSLAIALTVAVALLSFHYAPPARGPIWPHVYAALGGFFTLLLALGGAWFGRRWP